MKPDTISKRLVKGSFLNFIAVAFNQGSTLLVNVVVARILMKQSFGEYAMVQNTLLTVATLSQLSTGYTALKYVAENRSSDKDRTGQIMGLCAAACVLMSGIATILVVVIAPWLARTMLNAPHLSTALAIGSGFLFFSAVNGYQTGALSGLEAYDVLAKAGVASGIVSAAAISIGAWYGGLVGTFIGLSVSASLRCAIHNRYLRRETAAQGIVPKYFGGLAKEKAIIFRFALPALIAGYWTSTMVWIANSLLVRQPTGYGEMALYGAANSLRVLILFLPNVMNSVGLSILNNERSNSVERFHKVFFSSVLSIFLVCLGGALFVGSFGRLILRFFGKDFGEGYSILWLLLVSGVFEGSTIALYQYVQSKARMWSSLFFIALPRDTFLVWATYHLVQSYGGAGLATASLGASFLGFIFVSVFVFTLYKQELKPSVVPVAAPAFAKSEERNMAGEF